MKQSVAVEIIRNCANVIFVGLLVSLMFFTSVVGAYSENTTVDELCSTADYHFSVGPGGDFFSINKAIKAFYDPASGYNSDETICLTVAPGIYEERVRITNRHRHCPEGTVCDDSEDYYYYHPTIHLRGDPDLKRPILKDVPFNSQFPNQTGCKEKGVSSVPAVSLTQGTISHFEIVRQKSDCYCADDNKPIRRGGIAIFGKVLVEDCIIHGFQGSALRDPEMGLAVFCAANTGGDHPSTVFNSEFYDNDIGLVCGETEVIVAYNKIHRNEIGIDNSGGATLRIFSNWIARNKSHGIQFTSYWAWANWAEISNNTITKNGGDGIYLKHNGISKQDDKLKLDGKLKLDYPLCPHIRDNIIFENTGYGIKCEQVLFPPGYEPFTFYQILKNNNVWGNQFPSEHPTDPENNFFGCDPGVKWMSFNPQYVNVPQTGSMSLKPGRAVTGIKMYLPADSPGKNSGSMSLNPGQAVMGINDSNMLDIGYHYNEYKLPSNTYNFLVDTIGGRYCKIQDAINDAGPGDVIMVASGIYMENIYVGPEKGDLIIQSFANEDRPVIIGDGHSPTVNLQHNGVFSNFKVTSNTRYNTGIIVGGDSRVEHCNITDLAYGIKINDEVRPKLVSNTISLCSTTGILIILGDPQISFNLVQNNLNGIQFKSNPDSPCQGEVSNNTIRWNDLDGIHFGYDTGDEPLCPVVRDNNICENSGWGITSNVIYGSGCGVFPQLRYNNVWFNNYKHYWVPQEYKEDWVNNYGNFETIPFVPSPKGNSGRAIYPYAFNPKYRSDGSIELTSPCIDAGSLFLDPGFAVYYEDWGPLRDLGQLDLGHHYSATAICPWY